METLPNIHPGEVLQEDFLKPLGITPYKLAKEIGVGRMRISEIVRGERDITPDTALRLGQYFGIDAEVWLNLQAHYNLVQVRQARQGEYDAILRCPALDAAA